MMIWVFEVSRRRLKFSSNKPCEVLSILCTEKFFCPIQTINSQPWLRFRFVNEMSIADRIVLTMQEFLQIESWLDIVAVERNR